MYPVQSYTCFFRWNFLIIMTNKMLFSCIVDQERKDSRLPWLGIVLLCWSNILQVLSWPTNDWRNSSEIWLIKGVIQIFPDIILHYLHLAKGKLGCAGINRCSKLRVITCFHKLCPTFKKINKNPACGRHWISQPM